jgi:hypothetical protein
MSGNIEVAPSNQARFSNALDGDLLVYTDSNTQSILLGGQAGGTAFAKVTSSNVDLIGGLHMSSGYIVNNMLRVTMTSNTQLLVPPTSSSTASSSLGASTWQTSNFTFTLSNSQSGFGFLNSTSSAQLFAISSNLQIVAGSSGTSNAPTYTWLGDSNTGIFRPSACQVSFTTAGKLVGGASNGHLVLSRDNIISATNAIGMKNRIINGEMRIDQRNRGASVTVPNATISYGVDRFYVYDNAAAAFSIGQCNINYAVKGFQYAHRNTVTAGSTSFTTTTYTSIIEHLIENQFCSDLKWGTSEAQPVTVSFWMYANVSAPFYLCIRNANISTRSFISPINTVANTWQRYVVTAPGETSGSWASAVNAATISLGIYTAVGTTYQTGASNTWLSANILGLTGSTTGYIGTTGNVALVTGLQFERGTIATPFEFRTYSQELLMCQRYYYVRYNESGYDRYGFWSPDATTYGFTIMPFQTRMRTVPSFGVSAIADFSFGPVSVTSIGLDGASTTPECGVIRLGGSGFTPAKIYQIVAANKTAGTAWFSFNAEMV